jgi:hypothetical protein
MAAQDSRDQHKKDSWEIAKHILISMEPGYNPRFRTPAESEIFLAGVRTARKCAVLGGAVLVAVTDPLPGDRLAVLDRAITAGVPGQAATALVPKKGKRARREPAKRDNLSAAELTTLRQKLAAYDGAIDAHTVARLLNRPVRTIWWWAREGNIPATKVRRSWVFYTADLADFCDGKWKKPAASTQLPPAKRKLS